MTDMTRITQVGLAGGTALTADQLQPTIQWLLTSAMPGWSANMPASTSGILSAALVTAAVAAWHLVQARIDSKTGVPNNA